MVAANPKAARGITVWIVKAVEKASILFAQLQMDLSLFWRQATTSFNCIVERAKGLLFLPAVPLAADNTPSASDIAVR